jgi:hypothetical protein
MPGLKELPCGASHLQGTLWMLGHPHQFTGEFFHIARGKKKPARPILD